MTPAHDMRRCPAGDVEVARAASVAEKKRKKKKDVASKQQWKPALGGWDDNRYLLS